jgi:hypothetical protein
VIQVHVRPHYPYGASVFCDGVDELIIASGRHTLFPDTEHGGLLIYLGSGERHRLEVLGPHGRKVLHIETGGVTPRDRGY